MIYRILYDMKCDAKIFFTALSNEIRLRCLLLLQHEGEFCVCELTHALDLAQPVMRNLNIHAAHIHGANSAVSLGASEAQNQNWLSDETLADMCKVIPRDKTDCVYSHDGVRLDPAHRQRKHHSEEFMP